LTLTSESIDLETKVRKFAVDLKIAIWT